MPAGAQEACEKCGAQLVAGSRFCNQCGAPTQAGSPFAVEEASKTPIRAGDVMEGKWRVDGKLGQGGMGSVFVATDLALERKVAIKALATELCGDEEFVARFEQEAKSTANLEHPNVILVYGTGRHQGRPFIVMKWLQGESLSRRLAQMHTEGRTLPVPETLSIVRQVCAGLEYIHAKNLVHRDIKSGNIFLGPDGHATILDFGILRNLKRDDGLTRAGVVMGTPFYVSPEQAQGKGLDNRSDLYALGVMLYEMLTGAPPFTGANEFEVVSQHVHAPPPDPRVLNPSLPEDVAKVMQKAIAKKPAQRFQSAGELATALELGFAEDPELIKADGAPTPRSLAAAVTVPLPQLGDGPAPASSPSSRKTLWIGVGLGAAAAVAVAVVTVVAVLPDAPQHTGTAPVRPPPALPLAADPPPRPVPPAPKARPADPGPAVADEGDDDGADEADEPDGGLGSDDLIKKALHKGVHKGPEVLRPKKH